MSELAWDVVGWVVVVAAVIIVVLWIGNYYWAFSRVDGKKLKK